MCLSVRCFRGRHANSYIVEPTNKRTEEGREQQLMALEDLKKNPPNSSFVQIQNKTTKNSFTPWTKYHTKSRALLSRLYSAARTTLNCTSAAARVYTTTRESKPVRPGLSCSSASQGQMTHLRRWKCTDSRQRRQMVQKKRGGSDLCHPGGAITQQRRWHNLVTSIIVLCPFCQKTKNKNSRNPPVQQKTDRLRGSYSQLGPSCLMISNSNSNDPPFTPHALITWQQRNYRSQGYSADLPLCFNKESEVGVGRCGHSSTQLTLQLKPCYF